MPHPSSVRYTAKLDEDVATQACLVLSQAANSKAMQNTALEVLDAIRKSALVSFFFFLKCTDKTKGIISDIIFDLYFPV